MTTRTHTVTDSIHQIGVIVRLTLREARRRKLLWLALIMGIVYVAVFAVGFYFVYMDFKNYADQSNLAGIRYEFFIVSLLSAGLYVVNFLIVVVAALTTVGTVSAEIDSGTIHAIAAKPIRRWEIILGKWIGHAILITLYTLMLTVGVILSAYLISGFTPLNPVAVTLVLILESLAVLSLTMLGGTAFSTLANGIMVFMLYGVAFVGGWVEQIGSLLESQAAVDIGIASSLLMPSEGLWRYAAGLMQDTSLYGFDVSPFSISSQPTPAFIVYGVIYTVVLLLIAMRVFSQRDF
jgi:ABC-type transport system involved in multi-copper enzyme maturation permease subunit